MDEKLKKLLEIEKDLEADLKNNPVFIQLETIRKTIAIFQNGYSKKEPILNQITDTAPEEDEKAETIQFIEIPETYSITELTWNEKILFALHKIQKGFVSDIANQLKKLGEKKSEDWLNKRVGVTASRLAKGPQVGIKLMGKKGQYYMK